jgi:hypothetical protein
VIQGPLRWDPLRGREYRSKTPIGMNSLLNSIITFLHSCSIQLERVEDVVHVVHDKDGNDNDNDELDGHYSSELEQSVRLINSIAMNADFINLY